MDFFSDSSDIKKQQEETDISAEEFSFSDEMAEEKEEVEQILGIGDFDDDDFAEDSSNDTNNEEITDDKNVPEEVKEEAQKDNETRSRR